MSRDYVSTGIAVVQALVMANSVHLHDLGSGNTPVFMSPAFSAVTPAHRSEIGATPMEDATTARTAQGARPDAMLTGMSGRSTGSPMAATGQPRATTLARVAAANAVCLSEMDLVRVRLCLLPSGRIRVYPNSGSALAQSLTSKAQTTDD